jgi:hypothetical protein
MQQIKEAFSLFSDGRSEAESIKKPARRLADPRGHEDDLKFICS